MNRRLWKRLKGCPGVGAEREVREYPSRLLTLSFFLTVVVLVAPARSQSTAVAVPRRQQHSAAGANSKLFHTLSPELRELERRLYASQSSLPVSSITLGELAGRLRENGIPTVFDQESLEEVGVNESTPLKIETAGVPLGIQLTHALYDHHASWTFDERSLVISSDDATPLKPLTVFYDVSELVANSDAETVIDEITTLVEPDAWSLAGNGVAEIQVLDAGSGRALLGVSGTYSLQRKVRQMLVDLQTGARKIPLTSTGHPAAGRQLASQSLDAPARRASQPVELPDRPRRRGLALPNSGVASGFGGQF